MPDGGTLTIRSWVKDKSIIIAFKDTGVGIPGEDLAKIFDPFYTTKEKGTGLGLSIAQKIIEEHGGKIEVESRGAGTGAIFRVILPLNNEQ